MRKGLIAKVIIYAAFIMISSYICVSAIVYGMCYLLGRDFNFIVATLIWAAWYAINIIKGKIKKRQAAMDGEE